MNFKKKYAFIGIGSHSINNLYPVLNYLRIDLKYIVTKSADNASIIDQYFPNIIGTNDLDKVLNDEEISGVLICVQPKSHYELIKKALQAGKNVFVEKPPCSTIEELHQLIEIEKESAGTCLVGLQKRYAPVNLNIKKYVKEAHSYNYRFLTGMYPEGDPFLDIFIHPIDLVNFLFGTAKIASVLKQKTKNSITTFLQLIHENNTMGTIELSTAYSWKNPLEELVINTDKGIYKATNTEDLMFEPKHGQILKIPKEKIFNHKNSLITLLKRDNFNPIIENNQIYSSGYFSELKNFFSFCEFGKGETHSTLPQCLNTYQMLTEIKNKMYVQ